MDTCRGLGVRIPLHGNHEEVCDAMVMRIGKQLTRASFDHNVDVSAKHLRMSLETFRAIQNVHRHFVAFRFEEYKTMLPRGVLGRMFGLLIQHDDQLELGMVEIIFRYIKLPDDQAGILDPYMVDMRDRGYFNINHRSHY